MALACKVGIEYAKRANHIRHVAGKKKISAGNVVNEAIQIATAIAKTVLILFKCSLAPGAGRTSIRFTSGGVVSSARSTATGITTTTNGHQRIALRTWSDRDVGKFSKLSPSGNKKKMSYMTEQPKEPAAAIPRS
ncbi:MAG: hypothetical protein EOP84_15455 [Verrucomicrobiaceae bacterium]|nr:MAG: hypothetical protein EOP84_15455 [Verrucomicrobiaceae bacterium]